MEVCVTKAIRSPDRRRRRKVRSSSGWEVDVDVGCGLARGWNLWRRGEKEGEFVEEGRNIYTWGDGDIYTLRKSENRTSRAQLPDWELNRGIAALGGIVALEANIATRTFLNGQVVSNGDLGARRNAL
jgi:hypothetical protein